MKRIYLLLALLASMGVSFAQEKITAADVAVAQGGQGLLTVNMDFLADHDYVSYQMTIELPEGISLVSDAYGNAAFTLPENQPAAVFKITDFPASNGILKVASSPSTVIAAHEGTLVTIPVQAEGSLAIGTKLSGRISGVVFAHMNATAENFSDATFDIEVVEKVTVLDENSTTAPEAAEGVNVRVLRTIKANQWSTICLPFAMSEAQVKTAFGDDVQLADFNGYEIIDGDDENIVGINVMFNNVNVEDGIEANHPYLIKVSANVSEFTVDGVDVDPEDEPTVAAVKRTKKQWSEMIGTYAASTVDNQQLFLSNNQFWYSTGSSAIKGYRAYFDFYDVLTAVEDAYSSRICMVFMDEETGIKCLTPISLSVKGEGSIYSLDGRKVTSMRKGVYVKNNKKVVVK